MAKILISGYYGFGNFGDETILSVLVGFLRGKNHDVTVISNNPQKTSDTYSINSVKNFKLLQVISAIKACDILISGGGSLLQDVTSLKSLLYYALVILLAQIFNKKVIIFAQGIGPLQNKLSKKIVPALLKKCSIVTVRDEKSLDYLKANGVSAQLVSDPVFSVDLPVNNSVGVVGVQLRSFRNVDDKFLNNLARHLIKNFDDKKIELLVLQETLDYPICLKFEKILKKTAPYIEVEIIHDLSPNDLIMRISQLEYMIAMRFHAVLIAIKTGVKTLAINYDAKVAKLAYEARLPILTISGTEDLTPAFEQLKSENAQNLIRYCTGKSFEWTAFKDLL